MFVVKLRKVWYTISLILIALSLYGLFSYGLNLGIDFKGGTITQVSFEGERPSKESVEKWIETLDFGNFSIRPSGEKDYIIRTRELQEEERKDLNNVFGLSDSTFKIERSNTIGPVAGGELKSKALKAITVVVLMIVLFITFAFRKVSLHRIGGQASSVSSWKYGLATIIALAHDVIIPTGVFIFLGHFAGIEIDLLF